MVYKFDHLVMGLTNYLKLARDVSPLLAILAASNYKFHFILHAIKSLYTVVLYARYLCRNSAKCARDDRVFCIQTVVLNHTINASCIVHLQQESMHF